MLIARAWAVLLFYYIPVISCGILNKLFEFESPPIQLWVLPQATIMLPHCGSEFQFGTSVNKVTQNKINKLDSTRWSCLIRETDPLQRLIVFVFFVNLDTLYISWWGVTTPRNGPIKAKRQYCPYKRHLKSRQRSGKTTETIYSTKHMFILQ